MRAAVLLSAVANRTDEDLAPASGTQKQSGIVHRSPRRRGLDDPAITGQYCTRSRTPVRNLGAASDVDRQVVTVRGCAGLFAESDLTPTPEWRHLIGGTNSPLVGNIGLSARMRGRARPTARGVRTIQRAFDRSSTSTSTSMSTIYPHFSVAANTWASSDFDKRLDLTYLGYIVSNWEEAGKTSTDQAPACSTSTTTCWPISACMRSG